MSQIIIGIPPAIVNLVQTGLIERAFHDAAYPALLYRNEAEREEWPAHEGAEILMTRAGLLTPVTSPAIPGVDPLPESLTFEQWLARLCRYNATSDVHMPTSAVANADLFLRTIHQKGLQAGQSINRIARNFLFRSYLQGNSVAIVAAAAGDTTLRVASLSGFRFVVSPNVRPTPVSTTNPKSVTIAGVTGARNIIATSPDDPNDQDGPGTLTFSAVFGGAGVAVRAAVIAADAPRIFRSGGGNSVDAIAAGDVFTLQDLISAVNYLRKNNIPPHSDGHYHAHINTDANTQVFTDAAWQRLQTALPDHTYYQEAFIGTIAGAHGMLNNESPDFSNSGARTLTGVNAFYSREISAETTNETNVNIGRVVVTGQGALYERWLNAEANYSTEAGVTGKTGDFTVVNNGMAISTEGIRLILRAPVNRTQDMVGVTWDITTAFAVPSDITSGSASLFKRAVVIESALS